MSAAPPNTLLSVFTLGHSNHPIERFLELLAAQQIHVLADVRSAPYSAYCPQFNAEILRNALLAHGFQYIFLGQELGGRPADPRFYDAEGRVLYDQLAAAALFAQGLERLLAGARQYRIALLCGEEDPAECHRHLLVARCLTDRGVRVQHIRGDGRVETYEETVQRAAGPADRQLPLFQIEEAPPAWRSTRSVSPRKPPRSFSAR
jgi:uncharacterized protein (DUF488 family)